MKAKRVLRKIRVLDARPQYLNTLYPDTKQGDDEGNAIRHKVDRKRDALLETLCETDIATKD